MDSKEDANVDGHRPNTATENSEGDGPTIARQKKRARRVSFAEMTSVHFFELDEEDNETPLHGATRNGAGLAAGLGFEGQPEQGKESEGEDDVDNGDDDDDLMEMRRSFLRPIGSPSPGGSTIGSASSNDEDNFFGPVSANFIRPGRLSDSAASDDNHDVTMDSTAFSMHFRSLARSESGIDSRTPTGVQLFVEDKTPTNANSGSSMIFTFGKKPVPKSSMHINDVSGSHTHDSNDMSLVVENPLKYDYEKLSPGLDALLAESKKHLLSISGRDDIIDSVSTVRIDHELLPSIDEGDNPVNVSDRSRSGTGGVNSHDLLNGEQLAAHNEFDKPNDPPATSSSGRSPDISSSALGAAASIIANAKPNASLNQLSSIGSAELTLGAATTSPVNQLQNLLISNSPSRHVELSSPLLEQPGSFWRNEYSDCLEGQISIQKSISKLELLEKSALSSTLNAKVDYPTVKALDFSKFPNLDSLLEENHHVSKVNFVEDSFTGEKFASLHQNKDTISYFSMDGNSGEIQNHINGENHLQESLGHKTSGKLPNDLSARKLSIDQSKYRGPTASPSKVNWSNSLKRSLFPSKQSHEDAIITETEALLAGIASVGQKSSDIPLKSVSSPCRMLEKKSVSPGLQSSQRKDSLLENQFNQNLDRERSQDSFLERNLVNSSPSSATTNMDAVSMGMKGELCSASVLFSHLKDLVEVKATGNKEVDIYNEKATFGTVHNFISPAKGNNSQVLCSKYLEIGDQNSRDACQFDDKPLGEDFQAAVHGSVSPSVFTNSVEPGLQNLVKLPAASPSRKQLGCKESNILSPKSIQVSGGREIFSANKRNVELLLMDAQHATEMTMMQRSSKLQKARISDSETQFYPNGDIKTINGPERKQWTDVYSKFSEAMEQFIYKSAEGLSVKMIDMLGDMLVRQQKSQVYEILRAGVMTQNTTVLHDHELEKTAEANQLLQRILFHKAKLHLKHVKRERLLKKLELSSSKIQESQILRTKISSQPLKTCTTSGLVEAVSDLSFPSNLKKGHEACHEKLAALRQNLEALDTKILNLKKFFYTSCKIKAEPSSTDTIILVNEYLMKRACCRSIRLDIQMWVVRVISSMNGQHIVVLNYLDFIVQSIKVNVGPSRSVATSYDLNEAFIVKTFPNMDACTAFSFVFNAGNTHKYIGAKTLVQETQVTGSLLGSLLDVLEEVQLAQLQFRNLFQSRFCSQSAEQLDLMLSFINFNTGKKLILTLDMSCLKRGIYPSETIPLELGLRDDRQKYPLSGPIVGEMRDAVKGVTSGYMRILRLCKCVSQFVQAASGA